MMNEDELSQVGLSFERLRKAMKLGWERCSEMYPKYSLFDEDFHVIVSFLEECRNEIHPALEEGERR